MARERIAVVGIGCMGLPMAQRLAERGHAVVVNDRDASRPPLATGCAVASDACSAAGAADLVIVAVVDGAQTRDVLFGDGGLVQSLPRRDAGRPLTVLLCPTLGVADVEEAAARLAAQGVTLIDAPMSGGPARARAGTMSLMVAGDEAVANRWAPVLADLADPVFRVGPRAGDGARTKLVNNLLAAAHLAAAAEALALARQMGLDDGRMLDVLERSSGQSWIASDRLRRWLADDTLPRARMALLAKDSALALAEARRAGLALPLGAAAAGHFQAALAAGLADADDGALFEWARQCLSSPASADRSEPAPPAPSESAP